MDCPVCKHPSFQKQELENQLIGKRCLRCEGVWISAREYWQWVQTRNTVEKALFDAAEVSLPVETEGQAKICPECGHLLRRYKVWPNVKFYLDRCGSCQGVWFDRDEWDYLKSRGEHGHVYEFFGELWQEEVHEEERCQRLVDLYLERFGAEDYTRIKEIREWLWDHPQQGALLAYLMDKDPYRV